MGLLHEEDISIMEQEEKDELYQVEGFLDLLWGSCFTCSPSPTPFSSYSNPFPLLSFATDKLGLSLSSNSLSIFLYVLFIAYLFPVYLLVIIF